MQTHCTFDVIIKKMNAVERHADRQVGKQNPNKIDITHLINNK